MDAPEVKIDQIIRIKSSADSLGIGGIVLNIFNDGSLDCGYLIEGVKALVDTVDWAGSFWKFRYETGGGRYPSEYDAKRIKHKLADY